MVKKLVLTTSLCVLPVVPVIILWSVYYNVMNKINGRKKLYNLFIIGLLASPYVLLDILI